jgi:hypothetical protein
MKKNFLIFTFILLTLSASSLFAQFQGTIEIKETTHSGFFEPTTEFSKFMFLGSNVRIEEIPEESDEPNIVIMKSNEKKMIIFMPEDKQYIELDFQMLTNLVKGIQGLVNTFDDETQTSSEPETNAKKTGKSTTLHGFKCEEYIYSDEESISTAWICENFADFWKMFKEITSSFDKIMGSNESKNNLFLDAIGTNGFPFKVTEKGRDGELISEWEVIKVDKKKPNSNLFEIPKDYKELDIMSIFAE